MDKSIIQKVCIVKYKNNDLWIVNKHIHEEIEWIKDRINIHLNSDSLSFNCLSDYARVKNDEALQSVLEWHFNLNK